MDGIRLNDHESMEAFGVDKQKVVEEITRAYAHQIYVDGFFNGDPHPGTCPHFFLPFLFQKLFGFWSWIITGRALLCLKGKLYAIQYATCFIFSFVSLVNLLLVFYYRKFPNQQGSSTSSHFA